MWMVGGASGYGQEAELWASVYQHPLIHLLLDGTEVRMQSIRIQSSTHLPQRLGESGQTVKMFVATTAAGAAGFGSLDRRPPAD